MRYCTAPSGTLRRGERASERSLLRKRLRFLNGIEAALRIGVTEEPDEDEDEDDDDEDKAVSTEPVLCWSNPAKARSAADMEAA